MIAIEAFLMAKNKIDEVHLFSNIQDTYKDIIPYFNELGIPITITILDNFTDIQSENDHFNYEESLFRWYLSFTTKENNLIVCLAGGYKTISNSMQKACGLFGSIEVFHILTSKVPNNIDEIEQAISERNLIYVALGQEEGWQPIINLLNDIYKSEVIDDSEFIKIIKKPNEQLLKNHITELIHITKGENSRKDIYELPFNSLLMLPAQTRNWLEQPLKKQDFEWVKSLPKTELHCHLGGFATHGELLKNIQNAATENIIEGIAPKQRPLTWNKEIISLDQYMKLGDANGSKLLKDDGCLKKQIELLYRHLCEQNIKYAEIRCSPDNYHTDERTSFEVLNNIKAYFQLEMNKKRLEMADYCHVNLIVIVTRRREGDLSSISRHIALAITASQSSSKDLSDSCKIVAIDLAGFESKETRASYFMQDFVGVNRCGLAVTAHAGENDDAEGIWQAVYQLHARRLGHALHLYQANDLIRSVVDRKIGVEMCPYANFQIKGFSPMVYKKLDVNDTRENYPVYPLLNYLRKGVLVSINTDNIGISDANLTDNFMLLTEMLPEITRLDVLKLIRNGLETAFISPEFRFNLLSIFEKQVYINCKNLSLNHE